jgi:hypothetical protein
MASLFAFLALLPVGFSALVAGDFTQFIYKPSHRQLYLVYRYRLHITLVSLVLWLAALGLHLSTAPTSPIWLGIALGLLLFLTATAYIAVPFTLFTGIRNGKWMDAKEADGVLEPDTPLLTVVVNGDARAVPVRWMMRAHFWEDVVGGETVNLTFCPLSNTSVALKPEVNGQRLHLIVPSQLENNLVLYDTTSGSLIQQIDASVREGKYKGATLETYPSQIMSWSAWKTLYPDTKVLKAAPRNPWERFVLFLVEDVVVRLHTTLKKPFFPTIKNIDTRLPHTTEVIGLAAGQKAKAFSLDYLRDVRVINTDIDGQPVVIVDDAKQDVQFVYSRDYNGQILTFEAASDGDDFQLRDNAGQLWNLNGHMVDSDGRLEPANHMSRAFWFTWANFHPNTELMSV